MGLAAGWVVPLCVSLWVQQGLRGFSWSLELSTWDACSLHLMGLAFLGLQPACGTGRVLGRVKLWASDGHLGQTKGRKTTEPPVHVAAWS